MRRGPLQYFYDQIKAILLPSSLWLPLPCFKVNLASYQDQESGNPMSMTKEEDFIKTDWKTNVMMTSRLITFMHVPWYGFNRRLMERLLWDIFIWPNDSASREILYTCIHSFWKKPKMSKNIIQRLKSLRLQSQRSLFI